MKKKITLMIFAALLVIGFVQPSTTDAAVERVPKITGIQTTSFYALAE